MASNKLDIQITDILIIKNRVPIKISSSKYHNIALPPFATNYIMLMMDIDYPDKAKTNPNGSLFMKPTKEILDDTDSDIGKKFFGGKLNWNNIYNYTPKTEKVNDSLIYNYQHNSVINELLNLYEDGPLTSDTDNGVFGTEINQHTADRKNMKSATLFTGSPIEAIDKYITNSIIAVESLARAVSGENISELKKLVKTLSDLNSLLAGEVDDYLKKNNDVLKQIAEDSHAKELKELQEQLLYYLYIASILKLINKSLEKYLEFIKTKEGEEFNEWLNSCITYPDKFKKNIDIYGRYIKVKINGKEIKTITDIKIAGKILDINNISTITAVQWSSGEFVDIKMNELINYTYTFNFALNEADNTNDIAKQLLESFNFDNMYDRIQKTVSDATMAVCISDHNQWQIVKNALDRMNKLKEAADKEILAKIELICRTVNNGNSTLGEKFKSAISKHPMRAEGLKNIWSKYADDLNDRIESRIRSIGGANGNSSIFKTIQSFLLDTYPALIAMLITWKLIFMLCKAYCNKWPQVTVNIEKDVPEKIMAESIVLKLNAFATYQVPTNKK